MDGGEWIYRRREIGKYNYQSEMADFLFCDIFVIYWLYIYKLIYSDIKQYG